MDDFFIFLQHLVPQHLLSRFTGWLASLEHPVWLKNWVIGRFVSHFKVDMSEAGEPDYRRYANFNAFFTRALREGARPLAAADVVSPADGVVSQAGEIVGGRMLQAKGHTFSLIELLGGDPERAADYADGSFATIYLSPRDYHRVHMPIDGELVCSTYVPGDLFSVNGTTATHVDNLFARNERLVCHFDTPAGPMAMVLVGAMIVAGIETVWAGQVAPPPALPTTRDYRHSPAPVRLARGEEMGRFMLGSTVILVFGRNALDWLPECTAGASLRQGEALAAIANG
ncbi:phosphatidylserine decarboxylase [Mangrovimicrobium sediminis]|uniref:Phosphatidylserine decarboxylase proenzyme n=1 Tax=Mangrovimicrobium sediminis TaxID=2562682 RepID=A0A4Z0M1B2_9GAMM|nr:archaetidylserine decarboxylase [Haliea sp. SAOS-164]TGD73085.1 phosphatidylserine decarboxylase [Haliea sp. SAOS-164]